MTIPAIIYLVLLGISLLFSAKQHGEPRSPTNFWGSLIGVAIVIGLLWWGGFFT